MKRLGAWDLAAPEGDEYWLLAVAGSDFRVLTF